MTDVLFLWHLHQPRYVHPATGRPVLPWVRLHAASGYLDMARALERHPGVHVTVNFVPSLVEQLEAMLAGTRDELEAIAEKPTGDLDETERQSVLARCFSVRRDRALLPRQRYARLLAKRGEDTRAQVLAQLARGFTTAELRDLQCLFLIAWLGFAARADHPAVDQLDAKGRDYDEGDKRELLRIVRAAAGAVLPAWRRLAERGQVELATSPYFHPIVPLLVDTDVARRARPGDALPPRFARPEDAREQIARAQEAHARVFGAPARGMWPPEGSLSPEAVELYGALGVRWLAGDEEVLARSLDGQPAVAGTPRARARAWRHGEVDLVFRDRDLSDRIGFRYADLPAAAAVDDLLSGARAVGGPGGLVGLFLDGENAWETYPRRGADFLDALYGRLETESAAGRMRARTIAETLAERGGGAPLPRLHSGSWIEGSFRIWIGDPAKNEAWTHLGRARERLAAAEQARPGDPRVQEARRLLLAAEGSDWFWWYGEPFSSAEDPVFDELFRAHLVGSYRALGEEPPLALGDPIGLDGGAHGAALPAARIRPRIDGKADRFYEWQGAAVFEVGGGGAMADTGHAIDRLFVGFDEDTLYLRVDPTRRDRRRVAAARMVVRARAGERDTTVRVLTGAADGGAELRALGGRVGAFDVVQLALPLVALGARPRDELRLSLSFEFAGIAFARVPRDGTVSVTVPWPGWDEENWSA